MTYEEAIEELSWMPCDNKEALTMAKAAIEKQMPKKPMLLEGKRWLCSNCENTLRFKLDICAIPMNEQKYCMLCGQAVDWSDVE